MESEDKIFLASIVFAISSLCFIYGVSMLNAGFDTVIQGEKDLEIMRNDFKLEQMVADPLYMDYTQNDLNVRKYNYENVIILEQCIQMNESEWWCK